MYKNRIKKWVYLEALEQISYSGEGYFIWKTPKHGRKVGKRIGSPNSYGYTIIGYTASDGNRYFLRQSYLVWLYHDNDYPEGVIDHINRVKSDDRIENLRELPQKYNLLNSGPRSGKYKGVHYLKELGKFRAAYKHKNKFHTVGYFDTEEEAAIAYNNHVSHLSKYYYLNEV